MNSCSTHNLQSYSTYVSRWIPFFLRVEEKLSFLYLKKDIVHIFLLVFIGFLNFVQTIGGFSLCPNSLSLLCGLSCKTWNWFGNWLETCFDLPILTQDSVSYLGLACTDSEQIQTCLYWHRALSDTDSGLSLTLACTDMGLSLTVACADSGLGLIQFHSCLCLFWMRTCNSVTHLCPYSYVKINVHMAL